MVFILSSEVSKSGLKNDGMGQHISTYESCVLTSSPPVPALTSNITFLKIINSTNRINFDRHYVMSNDVMMLFDLMLM